MFHIGAGGGLRPLVPRSEFRRFAGAGSNPPAILPLASPVPAIDAGPFAARGGSGPRR